MKNVTFLPVFAGVLLSLLSCSKDDSTTTDDTTNTMVKISAKSTYTGARTSKAATVALSAFTVNLKDIKLKYDDDIADNHHGDDDNDGFFDGDDDFKLKGPFELNLLSGQVDLVATDIPQGVFKEIEFSLHRNEVPTAPMFNKSIEIKGTINGIPFVFWHNLQEEVSVDYHDASNNVVITPNQLTIVFNFNLDALLAQVDLSGATDGNHDGVIEISPLDNDGNRGLANLIKDKIEDGTELEDHHGLDD